MKTLLVIPCYRESRRLPSFLAELCAVLVPADEVAIQVVDDGSGADESAALHAVVESLRSSHGHLQPMIALPDNLGKGGAVYAGWRACEADTRWLAFVDADGSIPPYEVARLIQLARMPSSPTPAALIASRVKMLGRRVDRQLNRHLVGRVYATLVSQLLDIPVYDSQCGLKLLPRAAFETVAPSLSVTGFAFDVELITALLDHGTPVIEVPIDWHEVPGGKVRLMHDSWRMARDVWRIRQSRQAFKVAGV